MFKKPSAENNGPKELQGIAKDYLDLQRPRHSQRKKKEDKKQDHLGVPASGLLTRAGRMEELVKTLIFTTTVGVNGINTSAKDILQPQEEEK